MSAMPSRPDSRHAVLHRVLGIGAFVACILSGLAAQWLVDPPAEGEGWGAYEVMGFCAAAVVALIGYMARPRFNA